MGSNHGRPEPEKEKSLYNRIKDGETVPEGSQKGWLNLEKRTSFNMMTPEQRREICQKGAAAVNKLHGEKKTAKQSLEKILTLKIKSILLMKRAANSGGFVLAPNVVVNSLLTKSMFYLISLLKKKGNNSLLLVRCLTSKLNY